jgi:hypothetical protein
MKTEYRMRFLRLIAAGLLTLSASVSVAQGWREYVNLEEFFLAAMPAEPQIVTTTYRAKSGAVLPAKMFIATEGQRRYIVTVVHYMGATEADKEAALAHAIQSFRDRGVQVTYDNPQLVEGLPAHMIYLRYPDNSRTAAGVMWHPMSTGHRASGRLYILEGRVPAGQAPPIQFPQSFFYQDERGRLDFEMQNGRYVRNERNPTVVLAPYKAREPAVCADATQPAQGKPTPAQAVQYFKCTVEGVGDGTLFLLENVQVTEVGNAIPPDARVFTDVAAGQSVYPIKGSLVRYACEREGRNVAWGRADPGVNCATFTEANAVGHCYKMTSGAWNCQMSDLRPRMTPRVAPPQ